MIKRGDFQMSNREDGFLLLEKRLKSDWKIYVDTCSLYRTVELGALFWSRFERLLEKSGAKFTVTSAAFMEIKKHKHSSNHRMKQQAEKLEGILAQYSKDRKDLMSVAGKDGDTFHDNVIVSLIKKRCCKYPQAYITNDLAMLGTCSMLWKTA